MGTKIFELVTLTLKFDLLSKNFNLGHNFLTRRGRAFVFHMCIPCSKTFNAVPWFFSSDLGLAGWPTFKKNVVDYDFWLRGVTYCCYLHVHMVAAVKLCCLSDNLVVLSVCLYVCLSVVNFNLRYNFWTVGENDFIFGMHTPQWSPFKWHQGHWPCDLDFVDFDLDDKNSYLGYNFWTVRDTNFILMHLQCTNTYHS